MNVTNDDIRAMFSRFRKAYGWTQPGVFPHDMEGWHAQGYTQGLYDAMSALKRLKLLDDPGFVDVEPGEGMPERCVDIDELTKLVNEAREKEAELSEQLGYNKEHTERVKGSLTVSLRWDMLDALVTELSAMRTASRQGGPREDDQA